MRYPKGMAVVPTNGLTIARLYDTNIVTIDYVNNTIHLNNGGWETKHTKKCMNIILEQFGYYVYQKDFQWYVSNRNSPLPAIYENGIELAV